MRLEVTRSGGIAGLTQRCSLDTEDLPGEEGSELERLIEGVDLQDLERRSPIRGRGADRFQYEVRVRRQDHEHRVVVSEGEVPEQLRTVLKRVLERGKPG